MHKLFLCNLGLGEKKLLKLVLSTLIGISVSNRTLAQTPIALLSPTNKCEIEYPTVVTFSYNETRVLGLGVTTDFTYSLNGGPTITETRGAGALSSGITAYTFATQITSGLVIGLNSMHICVQNNCFDPTFTIYPATNPGFIGGSAQVCSAGNSGTLTLGSKVGNVVDWEYSTNGGVNWITVSPRNQTTTLNYLNLTTTTLYRASVQSGFTPPSTVANGACKAEYSSVATVTVNTNPAAPLLGSNTPVCSGAGNAVHLTASSPAAGATYDWTGPNGFTSGLQNPSTVSPATTAMSGTYSCVVTSNGCPSPASTTNVVVNQTPSAPTLTSNTPVCTGDNLNLSVTSPIVGTYSWIGPNSFNSTQTNPTVVAASIAATGTYSATNTVLGCTGPAGMTSVTMNQTPSVPIASSNSEICDGQTLNLFASTSPGAVYNWSGPNAYISTTQNPSFAGATPTLNGTYSVFASIAGCNSISTTTDVVVNPLPTPPTLSSNTPVCSGNTILLTSNTFPGHSYSWTGPNGFASTAQNPAISAASAVNGGTYSATIQNNATGCTSFLSSTNVAITATPVAPTPTSNSPVCQSGIIQLNATFILGATYSWTGPNGFTSTLQNPTLTAISAATGTYFLEITLNGCVSAKTSTNVVVTPNPVAPFVSSNSPLCVGDNLQLTAGNVTGGSFSWTGPSAFASTLQNPTIASVTLSHGGVYSVTVTVNGCTSVAADLNVVVNALPVTPAISSNTPVCAQGNILLNAATVSGLTYNWTGPAGFASTNQNPLVSNVSASNAGNYNLTVQNVATGCLSIPSSTNVVITSKPVAPSVTTNSPVCVGDVIQLSTPNIVGATYSWTGPNGFSSTIQNPTLTGTLSETGQYHLSVTVSSCTSDVTNANVVVNPNPAAPTISSNSPICAGANLNFTASNVFGGTFDWTGPIGYTSTNQNPTIANATTTRTGTYSAFVTVAGCRSVASTLDVVVNAIPAAPSVTSNSPICVGATLTLSASNIAGASYIWSGPNNFSSTNQFPSLSPATVAASGTYSVQSVVNGCTSATPGTNAVVVNSAPVAPVVASNSPICAGQNLNLSSSSVAGATYSWTGPNGFSSTLQNPTIVAATSLNAGTYFVRATASGCESEAAIVSAVVNAVPPAPTVGSNSPVCSGNSINLTAGTINSATYNWTGPNSFSSSLQNPSILNATGAMAGNYVVFASIGGCSGASSTINVAINVSPSSPVVSNDGPYCIGDLVSLTASSVAGSYLWTGPNGFTSTLQNPSFVSASSTESGIYSVSVTSGSCSSVPSETDVEIYANPVAPGITSNGPVCSGTTLNLIASPIAGAIYTWNGPNGFTSTLQNPSISAITLAQAGLYEVFATVNGCSGTKGSSTIVVKQTPATPAGNSNSPICEGADLHLNTPTVASATYAWNGPNGFSSALQNPNIVGALSANSGTYFIRVTVNSCTSDPGSVPVTISSAPSPPTASNNGPLCEGSSLQLNASNIVGAIYNWTGPDNFASSEQNPIIDNITLAKGGVYQVVATVGGGCTGLPGSTTVTVQPGPGVPSITSNSPICSEDDLQLGTTAVVGATYLWNGPNGFSSVSEDPILQDASASASGNYTLTVTKNGCSASSTDLLVLVKQTPNAPIATSNSGICQGSTLKLEASTISGASYTWSGPNSYTSNQQNPTISNAMSSNSGVYNVIATANGCPSPVGSVDVVINTVSMAGFVNGASTVCSDSNAGVLQLTGYSGNILNWLSSMDNGATWVNISNNTATQNFVNLTTSTIYTAVVKEGICPASVATTAKITVIPEVESGYVSKSDIRPVICASENKGLLTLRDYEGSIVHWETSIDGGVNWDTLTHAFDTLSYVNLATNKLYRVLVGGCSKMDYTESVILTVSEDACDPGLVVATLITPNGDNNNDTWLIQDIEQYPRMEVTIVNRYGVQVFHSDNYQNDWSGLYNGDYLPDGTYYYAIKFPDVSTVYKGHINIMK